MKNELSTQLIMEELSVGTKSADSGLFSTDRLEEKLSCFIKILVTLILKIQSL